MQHPQASGHAVTWRPVPRSSASALPYEPRIPRHRSFVAFEEQLCFTNACCLSLGVAQPGFPCPHDRLSTVGYLQLSEDVRYVVADGLLAEVEVRGDLRVAATLSDEVKDLALAVGQFREGFGWRGWLGSSEKVHDPPGNLWPEKDLAVGHGAHDLKDLFLVRPFEYVASRSGTHRSEH